MKKLLAPTLLLSLAFSTSLSVYAESKIEKAIKAKNTFSAISFENKSLASYTEYEVYSCSSFCTFYINEKSNSIEFDRLIVTNINNGRLRALVNDNRNKNDAIYEMSESDFYAIKGNYEYRKVSLFGEEL